MRTETWNPVTNGVGGVRVNLPATLRPELPRRRYRILYVDPPWRYRSRNRGRGGAADHYDTMSNEELKRLQLPAAKDCALFLWATWPLLPDAFELIRAWGFEYRSVAFCWVKLNPSGRGLATGLGAWTRANTEPCLLATRGRPTRLSRSVHSVVVSPRRRHSQKPDEVRDRIVELLGDLPRLELFARCRVAGWDAWGNEVVPGHVEQQPEARGSKSVHGSRALRAVPSSRRSQELRSHTLYGSELQAVYRVEIQGDDDVDTGTEGPSS